MKRVRRVAAGVALALVVLLLTFIHSCAPSFRMSSGEIERFFQRRNLEATQRHYKSGWRDVHYVQAGDSTKALVLFVHGSAGSLTAFLGFLTDTLLLKNALLITVDRPGFGYSNFGNAEPSLKKQAASLKPLVDRHRDNKPVILVGHSLGGPLIARMALDYPDLVDGLVIVAGSIDPQLEPDETWFRAPLATPFLSWLVPRSFRASNEEIYQLKPQLEEMLPEWQHITCPVIVIQGKKDQLVPYENAEFAKRMLVNAPTEFVIRDDMDHFVPWSDPELITNAILKMLNPSRGQRVTRSSDINDK